MHAGPGQREARAEGANRSGCEGSESKPSSRLRLMQGTACCKTGEILIHDPEGQGITHSHGLHFGQTTGGGAP